MPVSPLDTRPPTDAPAKPENPVLTAVADAVARLRFGVVQLTVHDGRVVQLDITDRQRFG